VRQTEKAEIAVKASQRRRAPNPGGAVQRNLNLLLKPRKTKPVHLGRQDQPITRPIITDSHIGTAHSKMSTSVSVMEGVFRNSIRSKKGSPIARKLVFFLLSWAERVDDLHGRINCLFVDFGYFLFS
jgi:hypothetical protein